MEAPPITVTLVLIIITVTHPTGDCHHVEAPPLTPEITADPEHIPHANQVRPLVNQQET